MKNIFKASVPAWTLMIATLVTLISLVSAAYAMNEWRSIVLAVQNSEEGQLVSPVQSLLASDIICERDWINRFRSWYHGMSVCGANREMYEWMSGEQP